MGKSKYDTQIQRLAKKATFTAKEARLAGIPSRMLSYFCKKGVIERISRGIYKGSEAELDMPFEWEDLALVALSIPKGVVCLISALCYYDLTDQMMRAFWIAVPHSTWAPLRPLTQIVRMRNVTLGQTEILIGKYRIKIFDRERTVIDAFRYLSKEVAIKALQAYLIRTKQHKPDLNKLQEYARKLRVNIDPYLMALTT